MMMADALIDIPSTRRIDKLENVQERRHSTGKVIMPSGGLTVISRYLRASQGSCHDMCKYGTGFSPETEPKIPRSPMRKIVAPKQGAGRNLERISESNLGVSWKKSEISGKVSLDGKIQESDDPVVIYIEQTQGHHLENVEEDLTDTKNSKVGVEPSDGGPVVINFARQLGNIEQDLTDTKNSKVGVEPSDENPVVINIAQTQGHHLGNVEEDLTDTKNSKVSVEPSDDGEPQSLEYPAISVKHSCEDPVDFEATATKGEAQYGENADTESLRAEKNPQVCMKLSPDSGSQKPVDPRCVEGDISSWTGKESVLRQQVLLSLEETDYAVAHAKNSKPKPQSKPSALVWQACSSSKQNSESPKRKEANIKSMTGVSGGRNKGERTIRKGIRSSMIGDKKNVVAPSVSPQVSNPNVPSINAKTNKFRNVSRSKKQESARQVKPEKLRGKNAKRSDNVKGVSHLMSLKNVKKLNSEQAKSANISVTTSYLAESNHENKPAESDRPCSSSKDKSIKQNQNRTPIVRAPRPYEKKKMIYKPKGIHADGLPPSLSSFPGRKSLRPTPNGWNITQPSLASSSLSASSMSSHNDTSVEHDKAVADKQKTIFKMMYKARPKKASMITPNNKHLPGKKLNFQRGKVVEIPVKDCTPRRLTFKKRELVDNRNDDNRKDKFENFSPRRLKFRQRANLDNRNDDNQNGRAEEFTPRTLKFRRDGDNQNSRIEEFSPRKLEFRRKLIVDNINGDNQNGRVEGFSPRSLEFSRSVLDNRNADDQNGSGEDSGPRKLIFRPKVVYIQNTKGSPTKNNFGRKEADVAWDNVTKIRSEKISLIHRDVTEKKGSGILYNNIIEQTASRLASTKASKGRLWSALSKLSFLISMAAFQIRMTETELL